MEYPIFDVPTRPLDIESIYPIGSVIFRSSPLADKTEWTEVDLFDSHFYVEWEGMLWELIVSIKPSDLEDPTSSWVDFHSDVHSVRNVRLQYSRTPEELSRGVCTAKMVIDNQSTSTFNLDTFTGENSHKLTTSEMPNHNHPIRNNIEYNSSHGWEAAFDYTAMEHGRSWAGLYSESVGGDQAHNNKELGYNLFMYKRIA